MTTSTEITSLEHVFNNSKVYEDIRERRNDGFADIERALEIVREYIVRKKRILYGGMSIDISLRLSDHPGIYADDAVPDYDFYSPDIEGDSDEIADIMLKAGFIGVVAQNAVHATTRRVKINYVDNVADVSYIPAEIYDRIPTQMYKGMRVTHPIFQWMDMHRALSQPFEKPPWEVIAHRVHKDIKRYRLMYEEYGVPYDKKLADVFSVAAGPKLSESARVDVTTLTGQMLSGYQEYAFMLTALQSMIGEGSAFHTVLSEVGILKDIQELVGKCADARVSYETKGKNESLVFSAPVDAKKIGDAHARVNIVSDSFTKLADNLASGSKSARKSVRKYYNMYGDVLRPRAITVNNTDQSWTWELFDNYGRMQPCFDMSETSKFLHKINTAFPEIRAKDVVISGPQNVLLYALQKYHDYGTPVVERAYHLYMYQSGIWVIEAAEKMINALRNTSSVDQNGLDDLYKVLPFFLTTRTYGEKNWSADYLSLIYYKTYIMRGVPRDKQKLTRPIYAYYPDKPHGEKKFDVTSSPIFQMNGAEVPGPFEPASMDPDHM